MNDKTILLSSACNGQKVILKSITGGRELRNRLTAMGLVPGVTLYVVKNGHPGPIVLKVKESKIVLGRGMSAKITVKTI